MNTIEKMMELFYSGSIKQSELEILFDAFLNDNDVREKWPSDASIIIPLAIARKDCHSRQNKVLVLHRNWKVAAVIFSFIVIAGSVTTYAMDQKPQIYSTDVNCDMVCAEQWLNNTIETAL